MVPSRDVSTGSSAGAVKHGLERARRRHAGRAPSGEPDPRGGAPRAVAGEMAALQHPFFVSRRAPGPPSRRRLASTKGGSPDEALARGASAVTTASRTTACPPADALRLATERHRLAVAIATSFPSVEAMQQRVEMGMVEGMRSAMGQLDGVLAEPAPARPARGARRLNGAERLINQRGGRRGEERVRRVRTAVPLRTPSVLRVPCVESARPAVHPGAGETGWRPGGRRRPKVRARRRGSPRPGRTRGRRHPRSPR